MTGDREPTLGDIEDTITGLHAAWANLVELGDEPTGPALAGVARCLWLEADRLDRIFCHLMAAERSRAGHS